MKPLLICISLVISVAMFSQERRLALVIGNGAYEHGTVLKNPVSDAYLISFTLEDLGFEVLSVTDASHREMEDAILNFKEQLEGADVALFYYTGQGMHGNGVNYLVPVDAKIEDQRDLRKEAVDVSEMVFQMEQSSARVYIFILDACGADSKGFLEMRTPNETVIAFSASPGSSAPENTGANGLYAQSITQQLMVSQPIENVFTNTRLLVDHASNGAQQPREWIQLNEPFGLVEGYPLSPPPNGSILLSSQMTGELYLNGLEITSVEPNTVIPFDNIEAGTYELKIEGASTWEESVLVLGNQITNVNANVVDTKVVSPEKVTPPDEKDVIDDHAKVFTDTRDSEKYPWMEFGSQVWMTRNLSFETPEGSYCYDNDVSNCDLYGRLYTWEAAQSACPDGWHLPSDKEWMELERFTGMKKGASKRIGMRGKEEGNALKNNAQEQWGSQKSEITDASGFDALPGGYNLNETKSVEKGETAIFWTSTTYNLKSAYYRKLEDSMRGIHRYYSKKTRGCSVRCVRD